MTGFRLLAIHAHPDDESSKGAATLARYANEGNEVMVLTCTGGERGSILNPAMDRPEVRENMIELRKKEMAKAAEILGIKQRWLGYVDSGLPEGDPLPPLPEGSFALANTEEATADVVEVIREFRPHVMITYDENGGYPHPDHIKTHAVSVRAWLRAGDPGFHPEKGEPWVVSKMYYTHGFVKSRFLALHNDFINRGLPSPYQDRVDKADEWPDLMERVTTQVNVADFFHKRDDALRAHATQIDPHSRWFAASPEDQRRVWPTEEFELAASRVDTSLPENDLFAGIDPDHQPENVPGMVSEAARQEYSQGDDD